MSRIVEQTMTEHSWRRQPRAAAVPPVSSAGPCRGFTMIELIVVIMVMAIAAAIVVPMASSAGSMQLRAAANMVAADLEYAKSLSITRGSWHTVAFDPTNEAYQIVDDNGMPVPHPVKKGFNYVVNFQSDSGLDRVGIVSTTFPGNGVTFDYLGSPSGSGGDIVLSAGSSSRTVSVEAITGFISVSN